MTSPTQRALAELKRRGWPAQIVEKWLPPRDGMPHGRRVDLFGCIDIVALDGRLGVFACQVTSSANISHRMQKAMEEPRIRQWVEAGNRFEVWGFAKRKPRGKRRHVWALRAVVLSLEETGALTWTESARGSSPR